jgi:hypothetical protein
MARIFFIIQLVMLAWSFLRKRRRPVRNPA